ncbi:MAG TPA: PVC-type heme-binding CxxCH protein [Gemmataceae bacterium]|jgi:putative membrane-bound dehydrogenase-like protein|nr:PVC-type heme-binding CxxCH protein [Gemmataceae bacterium]
MKRQLALFSALIVCHVTLGQDKPVPPAEAPGKMTLPLGFKATLFAGEPDVVQPIAFAFDDRGRMWVVECLSYPKWSLDGTGHDRVVMFEDTDGDGKHDKRTVIFDQGANLSGIELGHGGIWLCSSPNLVFIPCDFNADKPVLGKPEIALDGWNVKDTKHNIFNSLIWGPDGWLYGCNGIQAKANVGKPGAPNKDRVEMNCGVWRYHPTRKVFEAFAHGTTNPFGLDYDEYGEMFITNCVIKHLFHVVPGGHYDRMYGEDINKYSYQLMHSIADYIHWAGGDWTTSRGNKPEHSDAGGGHAHSGAMIYQGDNFPDEYRNTLFTCNIHGNRLNRDLLKRSGSGYKSERAKDFLFANDPWFRGIAVHAGPDGGVYVSDWCDTGECHNYDKVDLTNGRIHKVVYGTPKVWTGDLSKLSIEELVRLQSHKNDWFTRHARRLLHERAEAGERDRVLRALSAVWHDADGLTKLRVVWAMHAAGDQRAASRGLLAPSDSEAGLARRSWAIRLMMANATGNANPDLNPNSVGATCQTLADRLAFASGVQQIPIDTRFQWALGLLKVIRAEDAQDPNLPLMTWYAIEPFVGRGKDATRLLLKATQLPIVREFIARKATATDLAYIDLMLAQAVGTSGPAVAHDLLQGIIDGLGGAREVKAPSEWETAGPELLASRDPRVRERAMVLAVTFGDEKAITEMKQSLGDLTADAEVRSTALRTLLRRGKPDLLPILRQLLDDKALRAEAIRGLAAFDDKETSALLLKAYPTLNDVEKEDAVQTLAARPAWALELLDAIEKGTVPRRDVSAFIARQMQGLKDKRVAERLDKVWGKIQPASAQRATLTTKYKGLLTDAALAKADLPRGRQMFVKNCASCHKLYDDGGDVGPALTGAQRSNLDYILENVLDPSAVVPNDYKVSIIQLQNGRLINGIVKAETEKSITVRTSNETIVVPKPDIESRTVSKLSMMPDGIFEKMTDDEVRDLVAYLRGREQVPLPK